MGILRVIIGLLLVILPTTQSRSNEVRVAGPNGLQQSQVATSEVKENLYLESALVEIQEKATGITADDGDHDDFTALLNSFFGTHNFQNLHYLGRCGIQVRHSLAATASIPRYILYHCLIIPF